MGYVYERVKKYRNRLHLSQEYVSKYLNVNRATYSQMENGNRKITTYASITAKPFFEKRGYKVVKERQVERQGIFLTNYVMIKEQ